MSITNRSFFGLLVSIFGLLIFRQNRDLVNSGSRSRAFLSVFDIFCWTPYSRVSIVLETNEHSVFNRRVVQLPWGRRPAVAKTMARLHAARGLGPPYIRFCETNPIYFRAFFYTSCLFIESYTVCSSVCKWVRFPKTNPFAAHDSGVSSDSASRGFLWG